MGDLQSRRAIVEGIDSEGHFQKVIAKVPLAELDGYSSSLRSITQGRAKFKMSFQSYEAVPFDIQKRLIDEYSKTREGRNGVIFYLFIKANKKQLDFRRYCCFLFYPNIRY